MDEYLMITGDTSREFNEKLQAKVSEGWLPYGSLSSSFVLDNNSYEKRKYLFSMLVVRKKES